MSRVMNFNSGPGALPLPALERAQAELLDFAGTGMSVMEHSHRGKDYGAVHEEAQALLRELLGLSDRYRVLFLQGGASFQFAQVPLNLLGPGRTAAYAVHGVWGEKALAEAKATAALTGGAVHLAVSTGQGEGAPSYNRAPRPDEYRVPEGAAYLHVTTNETIHGIQLAAAEGVALEAALPAADGVPLVGDMSSDFLWRPTDLTRFGLVYAGAQKNIGPSGLAVVLVRDDVLARCRTDLPKMLRFDVAASNDSLYNTPPTFGVYMTRNVLAWCKAEGGLPEMERRNRRKAALVYGALDGSGGFYRTPVAAGDRSAMNVVFRLATTALEEQLLAEAKAQGMVGLKGHRSVGGLRASLYNAIPVAWAEALASFLTEFARRRG